MVRTPHGGGIALVGALLASLMGCGAPPCSEHELGKADLAVRPRLVMDGLVDLAAREQGHVQITEVVFHAPSVAQESDGTHTPLAGAAADDDALVFRYAIGAGDGLGDIVGGERRWQLAPSGNLVFAFAPATAEAMAELSSSADVDLSALTDQTAFVRGTVAVPMASLSGFATDDEKDGDPDTSPADGDPDTSPADGGDEDGDPDTSPADGSEEDGDPDTSPAHGSDEDGDPDTSPADGDDNDGDPDTSPARTDDADSSERRGEAFTTRRQAGIDETPSLAHVPFLLVVRDSFALTRSIAELHIEALAPEEVLAVDLHVDMDAIFSPERVAELDAVARGTTSDVVVQGDVDGAVRITFDAKQVREQAAAAPGIRVVGDRR